MIHICLDAHILTKQLIETYWKSEKSQSHKPSSFWKTKKALTGGDDFTPTYWESCKETCKSNKRDTQKCFLLPMKINITQL